MVDTCPCCGAFVFPERPILQGRVRTRILDYLRRHKGQIIPANTLADFVYLGNINGGCEYNSISVTVNKMNKILPKHGLRIKGYRGAGGGYELVDCKDVPQQ